MSDTFIPDAKVWVGEYPYLDKVSDIEPVAFEHGAVASACNYCTLAMYLVIPWRIWVCGLSLAWVTSNTSREGVYTSHVIFAALLWRC